MADLSGLHSPQLNWKQLKQTFVFSYWSSDVIKSSKKMLQVFQWHSPESPALNASRDALCLIHLGARYKDERLLLEGRTRHCAALKCMQEEVEKPGAATDDCILGAAYALGHCEVYKVIASNGLGWPQHVTGFQALLEIRGPRSIVSPYAQALLHNIRIVSVMDSFLKRKASHQASKEWIASANNLDSPAVKVVNLALKVGVALESSDWFCVNSSDQYSELDLIACLDDMVGLERDLQDWLVDAYGDDQMSPHRRISTQQYASFSARLGGLAHIIPRSIEYPSLLSATSHCFVAICLLLLRQCIANVARLHPYPLLRQINQNEELLAAVDETAQSLCESIAYFTEGDFGFAGILASAGPLHFAAKWFERRNDERLLWCTHVRDFLQQDALLGGSTQTSLDLSKPVFTWWMLPDIFQGSDVLLGPAVDKEIIEP